MRRAIPCGAFILAMLPVAAAANAFVPTMISANVMWVTAFPVIVLLEGWMMARWKWRSPYLNSLAANLLSTVAALPLGVGLSFLGGFVFADKSWVTAFLPSSARYFLAQVFLYGQVPVSASTSPGSEMIGVTIAAVLFIGICWCLTFVVEGWYYAWRNRGVPRGRIYRGTAIANLASYFALMAVWLPLPGLFMYILEAVLQVLIRVLRTAGL